jgi:hypothetical protein
MDNADMCFGVKNMAEQRSHTEAAERQVKSGFPGKLLFAGLLLLPALRRQTALVALMLLRKHLSGPLLLSFPGANIYRANRVLFFESRNC